METRNNSVNSNINVRLPFSQCLAQMGFNGVCEKLSWMNETVHPQYNQFLHFYILIQFYSYHSQNSNDQPYPEFEMNLCLKFNDQDISPQIKQDVEQDDIEYFGEKEQNEKDEKDKKAMWAMVYLEMLGCLIKQNQDKLENYLPLVQYQKQNILDLVPGIYLNLFNIIIAHRPLSDPRSKLAINILLELLTGKKCVLLDYRNPVIRTYHEIQYFSISTLIQFLDKIFAEKKYSYLITLIKIFEEDERALALIKFKTFENIHNNEFNINHNEQALEIIALLDIEENKIESYLNNFICNFNLLFKVKENELETNELETNEFETKDHAESNTKDSLNLEEPHSIDSLFATVKERLDKTFNLTKLSQPVSSWTMEEYIELIACDRSEFGNDFSYIQSNTLAWLIKHNHVEFSAKYSDAYEEYKSGYFMPTADTEIMFEWLTYKMTGTFACFPPVFKYFLQQSPQHNLSSLNEISAPMPFVLKVLLHPSHYALYQQFFDKFEKFNQTGDIRFNRSFTEFMYVNTVKFINLYEIMGVKLFSFLNGFMATSVLSLERFFNAINIIEGDMYLAAKNLMLLPIKITHPKLEALILLLAKLNDIMKIVLDDSYSPTTDTETFSKLIEKLSKARNASQIEELFKKYFVELYCNKLGVEYSDEIDSLQIMNLPLNLLIQLLVGRSAMETNRYKEVFDELLKVDLNPHLSFAEFTNDTNQSSFIGRELAEHNIAINRILLERGLDVEAALNYKKSKHLTFGNKSRIDFDKILFAIWQDVEKIEHHLCELPPDPHTIRLKNIIQNFKDLVTNKGKIENINLESKALLKIKQGEGVILLKKMLAVCNLLERLHGDNASFIEDINHLKSHHESLASAPEQNQDGDSQVKRFRIEQWDKNQITTFFLGNYVSCCLATNGGQFPAIVQRRMDNAMFMHVVIDEQIQQPVCLAWLFFANDRANDNDIYVVANFFEIRSKYGSKLELRDFLVSELIDFIGEYASDIHAKGFIMRPLTYGLIPNFDHFNYETTDIEINKIGGYLTLDNEGQEESQQRYYLNAIDLSTFHIYRPRLCLDESAGESIEAVTKLSSSIAQSLFKPHLPDNSSEHQSQDVPNRKNLKS